MHNVYTYLFTSQKAIFKIYKEEIENVLSYMPKSIYVLCV